MATVQSPVSDFNGVVAGVTFEEGAAETDDARALSYFRRHGYTVNGRDYSAPAEEPAPHPVHARVGTPLRDAAAVEDGASDADRQPVDAGEASPEPYDPADHNVGEVNTYLAQADDDERARVLAAERDGGNRKGIVEGPHA